MRFRVNIFGKATLSVTLCISWCITSGLTYVRFSHHLTPWWSGYCPLYRYLFPFAVSHLQCYFRLSLNTSFFSSPLWFLTNCLPQGGYILSLKLPFFPSLIKNKCEIVKIQWHKECEMVLEISKYSAIVRHLYSYKETLIVSDSLNKLLIQGKLWWSGTWLSNQLSKEKRLAF